MEKYTDSKCQICSGGSRIFPRGGANSQNCYYFSHFCRKLHENERIWTPRGVCIPGAPLGSTNDMCWENNYACIYMVFVKEIGFGENFYW